MGGMGNAWSTVARVEGAVSVVVAIALAVTVVAAGGDRRVQLAWLCGAAIVALVIGVAAVSAVAIGAATVALGFAYVVATPGSVTAYAVGLYVMAECALWSGEDRMRFTEQPGPRVDRVMMVAAIGSASVALGAVLRLLGRHDGAAGSSGAVIGGVSVAALAALLAFGVRRLPGRTR